LELSWIKSCIFGLLSGLLDIIPVSAQAHSVLLLKFFGMKSSSDLMNLLIHAGVFAALYYSSQTHLVRMPCQGSGQGPEAEKKTSAGYSQYDGLEHAENNDDSGAAWCVSEKIYGLFVQQPDADLTVSVYEWCYSVPAAVFSYQQPGFQNTVQN